MPTLWHCNSRLRLASPLELAQSEIETAGACHRVPDQRRGSRTTTSGPRPVTSRAGTRPDGDSIRLDTYCRAGERVSPYYDSMIGKLIIRGADREEAIGRLDRALGVFEIGGLRTNLACCSNSWCSTRDFRNNAISTRWLEQTGLPAFAERQQEPHHGAH